LGKGYAGASSVYQIGLNMKFLENYNSDWMDLLNFYERPFRAKLVPAKVLKDLDKYRNDAKGLANYLKKWRTKVVWREEKSKASWTEKYVCVGGEYDPETRQSLLIIHTTKFDTFNFTDEVWQKFKFRLLQTLMHELIHFMQYDRRDDTWSNYVVPYKKVGIAKKDAERKYLSEFDEIQAYAHCVYLDFKMLRPHVDINTLLNRCKKSRDSKTLHYFLKTFDYDFRNNESPRKIIDQIGKWDRKYERTIRRQSRPK
jgi:hypothetical protein